MKSFSCLLPMQRFLQKSSALPLAEANSAMLSAAFLITCTSVISSGRAGCSRSPSPLCPCCFPHDQGRRTDRHQAVPAVRPFAWCDQRSRHHYRPVSGQYPTAEKGSSRYKLSPPALFSAAVSHKKAVHPGAFRPCTAFLFRSPGLHPVPAGAAHSSCPARTPARWLYGTA